MDVQVWQVAAALAVPVLGFLGAVLARDRDPALYRKLKHASTALKDAPEGSDAKAQLDRLVAQQARILANKEYIASQRVFKPINLFFTLIVVLVLSGLIYLMILWVTFTWGTVWAWFAVPATAVVAFASLLLIAAGVSTIYQFRDPGPRQPANT